MKKAALIASVLLLGGLTLAQVGCLKKKVDVVNGVPPVSTSLGSIAEIVNVLGRMPPSERGAYLERTWPHLQNDVVYYLRTQGKISQDRVVDRIEFRYGSLDDVRAESGDGRDRYGFFDNQLIALVYPRGLKDPIVVIVQCLNGTFALLEDLNRLQLVGSHTPQEQFVIGPGEGLIHHVDFPVAIDLAERFNLPLYRGREISERNRITPEQARRLESTTDRLQVTVYVVEGDRFDLLNMIFDPSPRRANRS